MIYGIVPVGGKGTRLSLPYAKELLPLKGKDSYYPVCQYTIDNLLSAGCEKIFFVHGKDFKESLVSYYSEKKYVHIKNTGERQSEIFVHFKNSIQQTKEDIYLYGLPDTWYETNLFPCMKNIEGLVCGMFQVSNESVVDRLDLKGKFTKRKKEKGLSKTCWGVLKLDQSSLDKLVEEISKKDNIEVAEALNCQNFTLVEGGKYFDLGTWKSINEYWKQRNF